MVPRWAVIYFTIFTVLFTIALLAVFKAHDLLPPILLSALTAPRNLALVFVISSLFLFLGTRQLKMRPRLYVPSGLYRILSACSNEKNVLLTLLRVSGPRVELHPDPKGQEKIEAAVKRYLASKTGLYCVPIEWFQVKKGLDYTEEDFLLCKRVKTHAMIFVSSDFFTAHCVRKNPPPATDPTTGLYSTGLE